MERLFHSEESYLFPVDWNYNPVDNPTVKYRLLSTAWAIPMKPSFHFTGLFSLASCVILLYCSCQQQSNYFDWLDWASILGRWWLRSASNQSETSNIHHKSSFTFLFNLCLCLSLSLSIKINDLENAVRYNEIYLRWWKKHQDILNQISKHRLVVLENSIRQGNKIQLAD